HIPKVRYYQGKYFDSIKYGILREDWEKINDGYYQINGNS
ncbi:TPA: N-acetyltransferase, partial [Streptococcus pneumoniae]|nr:N-acetyltransferase [Streptococcus pneumoniae]